MLSKYYLLDIKIKYNMVRKYIDCHILIDAFKEYFLGLI